MSCVGPYASLDVSWESDTSISGCVYSMLVMHTVNVYSHNYSSSPLEGEGIG